MNGFPNGCVMFEMKNRVLRMEFRTRLFIRHLEDPVIDSMGQNHKQKNGDAIFVQITI